MTNGFIVFPVVLSCCVSLRRSSATPLLALDMFQLFWLSKSEPWLFGPLGSSPKNGQTTKYLIGRQENVKNRRKRTIFPFDLLLLPQIIDK